MSSEFLGTHSSCMHTFLKHLVTQCESQVRKLKIQFSIFKELPAAAPCLDFSWARHLSPSLALTLLQWGIPAEHKASLLTCKDLSLMIFPAADSTNTHPEPQPCAQKLDREGGGDSVHTMEHTQAQLVLADSAVLHTRKTFKTATCFKLYQV